VTRGTQSRSITEPVGIRRDDTEPERTPRDGVIALISVCLGFFVIQLDAMCRS
jgi:hypothetical protein